MKGEASRRKPRSRAANPIESARAATTKARRRKREPSDRPDLPSSEVGARIEAETEPKVAATRSRRTPIGPVTRAWVLERLVENVKRAMQIEEVKLRGVPTGEYRYEGSVANRALELIGKELGLFVDRSESVNTHHVVSDEPITEAQWEERYASAR
jgi:hypothetical protein